MQEALEGMGKRTDGMLNDLKKRRIKLNDGDILDNLKAKRDQLDHVHEALAKVAKDEQDLE